ncbi:serine/threonine-protein kinase [Nonomuraea zeae]
MVIPLTPDDPAALGGFRLAGRLGEGGQGVVYLAHAPSGEPVAIKLLSAGDKQTRARLARELEALEGVASFCTARVLDVSTGGPRPFVVSEFVDGPSVADRVRERGPLRGGELERLMVGTATALAAIHAAGIVHRDFKPANVLLGPDGPRVVDFGIARAEGAATMTSGLIGTPAYLAPEQISGMPAAPASDVFAWAASMLYAATGTSPFGADTVPAVLHRVLHAEPDLSALPPRLRGPIAACLDKDPARRPTAQQLMVSLVGPNAPRPTPPPHTPTGPAPPGPARPAQHGVTGAGPAGVPAYGQAGGRPPDGAPPPYGGPTGPGRRDGDSTDTSRSRSRSVLIGVVASLLALGAAVGTTLYLNRDPASGDDARSVTTATRSSPAGAESSPAGTGEPPAETTTPPEKTTPPTEAATSASESEPPTPEPGGGLEIPAAFAGTWSGHVTSTNPADADGSENKVTLKKGESTAAWSEQDPDESCTGTITLTKVERSRLTFTLGQNDGGCIPGTIWLDLKGDTLAYTWRDVPGLGIVTQTGALKKG